MVIHRPLLNRFLSNPGSFRYAAAAITGMTLLVVLAGAAVVRVFDPDNFETFGEAVWFTLQTATTVGYGDEVPTNSAGRTVAGVVMLLSVGIVTVVTAFVTSLFVHSTRNEHLIEVAEGQDDAAATIARLEGSIAAMREQLDRIEQHAAVGGPPSSV
jgi:voltage-gated potassium channel Kch